MGERNKFINVSFDFWQCQLIAYGGVPVALTRYALNTCLHRRESVPTDVFCSVLALLLRDFEHFDEGTPATPIVQKQTPARLNALVGTFTSGCGCLKFDCLEPLDTCDLPTKARSI